MTAYMPRTTTMKLRTYETLLDQGFKFPPLPPQVNGSHGGTEEPEEVMFVVNEVEEE